MAVVWTWLLEEEWKSTAAASWLHLQWDHIRVMLRWSFSSDNSWISACFWLFHRFTLCSCTKKSIESLKFRFTSHQTQHHCVQQSHKNQILIHFHWIVLLNSSKENNSYSHWTTNPQLTRRKWTCKVFIVLQWLFHLEKSRYPRKCEGWIALHFTVGDARDYTLCCDVNGNFNFHLSTVNCLRVPFVESCFMGSSGKWRWHLLRNIHIRQPSTTPPLRIYACRGKLIVVWWRHLINSQSSTIVRIEREDDKNWIICLVKGERGREWVSAAVQLNNKFNIDAQHNVANCRCK